MPITFVEALTRWEAAERTRVQLHIEYECAYAQALISADGKNAEVRKAQADLAASEELQAFELATAEAKALEHMVFHLRRDAA